jgi:hypothetical protein
LQKQKQESMKTGICLLILGLALAGYGLLTHGLFSTQLPSCFVGGLLIGAAIGIIQDARQSK